MATLTLACSALLAFVGARAWPRSRRHKHEEAFNSVQRGHQNMLESWGPVCCLLLANGLVFPRLAAVCGVLYSVGRILYSRGYKKSGADGRFVGGLVSPRPEGDTRWE